ncbi:hypothetical protein [Ruegeria jejuensis]|uniref:hypothetical protein n=1 Tax=Ruegeria jejuensis TaxID=3233338 RepID=UPI00355C71CB
MTDVKSFLTSKTVWGAIIAILPQLALIFGFQFTEADAADLQEKVSAIISALGGIYAMYGRVVAKEQIGLKSQ